MVTVNICLQLQLINQSTEMSFSVQLRNYWLLNWELFSLFHNQQNNCRLQPLIFDSIPGQTLRILLQLFHFRVLG